MSRTLLPLLAVFGLLFSAHVADAANARLPASGEPAYAFETPAGWTLAYDQTGNLQITASDDSSVLVLSLLSDPAIGKLPVSDLAAQITKSSGASPYTRTTAGGIAGLRGTAFFSQVVTDKGDRIGLRLDLVKLDASHLASMVTITTPGMTSAQTAALEALIQDVRFVGLK
jgi:hypothetical protein